MNVSLPYSDYHTAQLAISVNCDTISWPTERLSLASLLVYFQSFSLVKQADLVTGGYGSSMEGAVILVRWELKRSGEQLEQQQEAEKEVKIWKAKEH